MSSWWSNLFGGSPKSPTYEQLQDRVDELEKAVKKGAAEYKDLRKRMAARHIENEARLKRALDALRFYADRKNWSWRLMTAKDSLAERERGRRARAVLGQD